MIIFVYGTSYELIPEILEMNPERGTNSNGLISPCTASSCQQQSSRQAVSEK